MALINCPECGQSVSDKAPTCPHCGAPINMKVDVPVTFFRERKFVCAAYRGNVYVDGQLAGTADNGDSFTVYLAQGAHQVHIETIANGMNRTKTYNLEVPNDVSEMKAEVVAGMMSLTLGNVTCK